MSFALADEEEKILEYIYFEVKLSAHMAGLAGHLPVRGAEADRNILLREDKGALTN